MFKSNNKFKHFVFLILYILISQFVVAEDSAQTDKPIWAGMKTNAPATDNTDSGFAAPPPESTSTVQAEKLSATIIASQLNVPKGEPVTFTLQTNASDVRYYWISEGQKGSKKQFVVDTSVLEAGKHRVRATVTNKLRQQAHASLFFNVSAPAAVVAAPDSDNSKNPATVIELPAATAGTSQADVPASPTSDNDQTDYNKKSDTSKHDAITEPDKPDELPAATESDKTTDDETESVSLQIKPDQLSIKPGDDATFTSSFSQADGYRLRWKFTDKRGINDTFVISSVNLLPGIYEVHLTAIDANDKEYKAQATLTITDKSSTTVTVPDVSGLDIDAATALLQQQGLLPGEVSQQETATGNGLVLEQRPKAGEQLEKGQGVDLVISIPPAIVITPNLLGRKLENARKELSTAGLTVGQVSEKVDDNAIGLVLEQNIPADTEIKRGSSVDLVIGKAAPKPLSVSINPVSAIAEAGTVAEFNAIIVDPEIDNNLTFFWKTGDLSSSDKTFKIDTRKLAVGEHSIELTVKDSDERTAEATATLEITPETATIPDIHGKSLADAQEILKQAGFKVNIARRQPANVSEEQILQQTPKAGEKAVIGSTIQLTLAIPQTVESTSLSLSVDHPEIKLGESVIFKTELDPIPEDKEIHYVYSINSAKKANVQPTLEWKPEKEGIYSVSVTAFSESGILAKSEAVTVTVAPKWELPVAKIVPEMQVIHQGEKAEFISTSTYDLNTTLSYDWSSDTSHGGSKKQFVFDTSDITPGSYNVQLTITDKQGNTSIANAMLVVQAEVGKTTSSSTGQGGEKNPSDNTATPLDTSTNVADSDTGDVQIHLSTSRKFVSTNTKLQIKAISNKPLQNAYYYFEPGDGQNTQWLSQSELTHSYSEFGTYLVRAAVKQGDKVYYSDSVTIWVWSPLVLVLTAGIGLFAYLFMWWWTKRIPAPNKPIDIPLAEDASTRKPEVVEEQIPLKGDENDIVTEPREAEKERTVGSILKRALLQFILGLLISVIVIYVILKSINLL